MDTVRLANTGYTDLRDFLRRVEDAGELLKIDGAHWDKEIGALNEMISAAGGEQAVPAVLFDNIPGSPKGFRLLM